MVKHIAQNDGGRAVYARNPLSQNGIVNNMQRGNQIFATTPGELNHTVLLNRVTERTITKISGRVITQTIYHVMDPARGQYTRLSNKLFNNSNVWLRIFK